MSSNLTFGGQLEDNGSPGRNTDLISVEKLLSTVDGIPSVPPSPPLGLGASAFALTSPSLTDEVAGGDL